MKPYRRRFRLLADWKLQGHSCLRICGYWLVCQLVLVATILGFLALAESDVSVSNGESAWRFIIPALVSSTFFLPMVLLDNLRFTNKLAGPLMRLRREMQQLADGENGSELHFRPGDYLVDMDKQFNAIRSRLDFLEQRNGQRLNDDRNQSQEKELSSAGCAD